MDCGLERLAAWPLQMEERVCYLRHLVRLEHLLLLSQLFVRQ
jgi:hypothetical protein